MPFFIVFFDFMPLLIIRVKKYFVKYILYLIWFKTEMRHEKQI